MTHVDLLRAHLEAGDDARLALLCIRLSRSRAGRDALAALDSRERRQVMTARARFESQWRAGARVVDLLADERRRREQDPVSAGR